MADPLRPPAELPRELLSEIYAHARECYPEECCGLLLGPSGAGLHILRCTNVQSQRFARGESHLDARRGFWIDAQELESALREAEGRGERLHAVYHSHIDTEAYLSHTDLLAATGPGGSPVWPGVAQLVISVRDGAVRGAALFEWDTSTARFLGRVVRESR